jgi:hypothetical protein
MAGVEGVDMLTKRISCYVVRKEEPSLMSSARQNFRRRQAQHTPGLLTAINEDEEDSQNDIHMQTAVQAKDYVLVPLWRFTILCLERRNGLLVIL